MSDQWNRRAEKFLSDLEHNATLRPEELAEHEQIIRGLVARVQELEHTLAAAKERWSNECAELEADRNFWDRKAGEEHVKVQELEQQRDDDCQRQGEELAYEVQKRLDAEGRVAELEREVARLKDYAQHKPDCHSLNRFMRRNDCTRCFGTGYIPSETCDECVDCQDTCPVCHGVIPPVPCSCGLLNPLT